MTPRDPDSDHADDSADARHDRWVRARPTLADHARGAARAMALAGTSQDVCTCGHARAYHPAGYCNQYPPSRGGCRCMAFAAAEVAQ